MNLCVFVKRNNNGFNRIHFRSLQTIVLTVPPVCTRGHRRDVARVPLRLQEPSLWLLQTTWLRTYHCITVTRSLHSPRTTYTH